jgi:hypothetical protein
VLVVGGDFPITSEVYDPASGTWAPTAALNASLNGFTATLLPSGQVVIAGGSDVKRTEIYNPTKDAWRLDANLVYGRRFHTANLLPNGSVLVTGGIGNSSHVAFTAEIGAVGQP